MELLHLLDNRTALSDFRVCIDYKHFEPKKVREEFAYFSLSGPLIDEATRLYTFLARKYCFQYWFVQISYAFDGGWRHNARGSFVKDSHANEAFGAVKRNFNKRTIYVAWSNSLRE